MSRSLLTSRALLLRCHLRTLFSGWHLAALAGLATAGLLWPAGSPSDQQFLAWLLERSELLGPLALMPLTAGLLQVDGRVDERWGTAPAGLGRLFMQRWLLTLAYFALALGLFLALAGLQVRDFSWWRTFPAALVSAALFSLAGPLVHHATGSAGAGWAAGLAVYLGAVVVSQFWCPHDSVYQLWLPFAGLSDAPPAALAASKAAFGLGALGLLAANLRVLAVPERLLGRAD